MYKIIPGVFVSNEDIIFALKMVQPICTCKQNEVKRYLKYANYSFWSHEGSCRIIESPLGEGFDFNIWQELLENPGSLPNCAKCLSCGENRKLTVDHIIPQNYGGGNTLENYRLLCASCNNKRGCHINNDIWLKMNQLQRIEFCRILKQDLGSAPTSRIRKHIANGGSFQDIYPSLFWIGANGFTYEAKAIEDNICLNSK